MTTILYRLYIEIKIYTTESFKNATKKAPGKLPRACFIIHSKPNTDISSYLSNKSSSKSSFRITPLLLFPTLVKPSTD